MPRSSFLQRTFHEPHMTESKKQLKKLGAFTVLCVLCNTTRESVLNREDRGDIVLGFQGNYPPTPPLTQHFALSEK